MFTEANKQANILPEPWTGARCQNNIFTCVALAKAGLVLGPLRPSVLSFVCLFVHLSVRPSVRNTFGVPSLCNLLLQQFSFLYVQTLPNDCSYIEDVHLLFCAHLINIFFIFYGC